MPRCDPTDGPVGRERRDRQRAPAADRRDRGPALLRQVAAHDAGQPRAGDHVPDDGDRKAGPPVDGGVAVVRPRQELRRPADVRRNDVARQGGVVRPDLLRLVLGQRLPAVGPPGREVPRVRRPCPLLAEPGRHRRRASARDARRPRRAQPDAAGPHRRPGGRHADRPVRTRLPDADVGARADRLVGRVRSPTTA